MVDWNLSSFLEWDSKFFGMKVGRLYVQDTGNTRKLLEAANNDSYDLIYLYSKTNINYRRISSYVLVDVGGEILYSKPYIEPPQLGTSLGLCISRYMDARVTDELHALALVSGHLSRFNVDQMLPHGSFSRLYHLWIHKTLNKQHNGEILVATVDGHLAGMISLEFNGQTSHIQLLAVSKDYQRQGLGSQLLKKAEQTSNARGMRKMLVKTQLTNAAARSLYTRHGYTETDRYHVYHGHRQSHD